MSFKVRKESPDWWLDQAKASLPIIHNPRYGCIRLIVECSRRNNYLPNDEFAELTTRINRFYDLVSILCLQKINSIDNGP